jgi:hypothetical protein
MSCSLNDKSAFVQDKAAVFFGIDVRVYRAISSMICSPIEQIYKIKRIL